MATDIEIFIGTSQDFLLSFKVKKADNVSAVLSINGFYDIKNFVNV